MLSITDKEFRLLSNYIQENYGIYLKKEKKMLIIGRLQAVLAEMGFDNFTEYYDYIISDKSGDSVVILLNKITTNHTFFMRESEHFFYLRDNVLPYFEKNIRDRDLRTWCAASSTGEEPYILAMILDEYFNSKNIYWDKKLLATDISTQALDVAKKGIYNNKKLAPLSKYWKLNYLNKYDNDNMIFKDSIKKEIIFRRFNLMEEVFPFKKKFHIIFCRNVMIYFDDETKYKLIQKIYNSMEYGGYLFIGHSESLVYENVKFKYVCPSVYRKQ